MNIKIKSDPLMLVEYICLDTPTEFAAVGFWYDDFSQTDETEVVSLLKEYSNAGLRHQCRLCERSE